MGSEQGYCYGLNPNPSKENRTLEEYYPFTMRGPQESYGGSGRRDGETYKSPEFELRQGILIAEIQHDGHGDFKLEFVPAEGFSRGEATAASLGGSFAAGAATGAVIGSVVPVAGTILGGLIGGAAGWLTGEAIGDAISPTIWTAIEHEGEITICRLMQVNENEENCLNPGRYRLEVKSQSRWSCRFIQPDLNQSAGLFTDDDGEASCEDDSVEVYVTPFITEDEWSEFSANHGNEELAPPGMFVMGPYRSGGRPMLAHIKHDGRETFNVEAFSVDGTHYSTIIEQEGQFLIEDHQTEIRPGKEYILYVYADGAWDLSFTEGY